jgi:hypothetical protein
MRPGRAGRRRRARPRAGPDPRRARHDRPPAAPRRTGSPGHEPPTAPVPVWSALRRTKAGWEPAVRPRRSRGQGQVLGTVSSLDGASASCRRSRRPRPGCRCSSPVPPPWRRRLLLGLGAA